MSGRGKSSVLPAWMTSSGDSSENKPVAFSISPKSDDSSSERGYLSRELSAMKTDMKATSETDNILNALKGTPSIQPVSTKGKNGAKGSSKRYQPDTRSDTANVKKSSYSQPASSTAGYMSIPQFSIKNSGNPFLPTNVPDNSATAAPLQSFMPTTGSNPFIRSSVPAFSTPFVSAPTTSNNDWKVFKTNAGVEYYYNQKTQVSTYDKPDDLKADAEKMMTCAWQEFKTANGQTYWFNKVTQISVWEEPKEYTEFKKQQSSYEEQSKGASPFISTIQTAVTQSESRKEEATMEEEVKEAKEASEEETPQTITWTTPAEARAAFETMLREKCKSSMNWKDAASLITSDIRYTALKTIGERKQCFSEYMTKRAKEEREERALRLRESKDRFRELLKESPLIKSTSSYKEIEELLKDEERWNCLEARDREDEIRIYKQTLQIREKEERRIRNSNNQKAYRELLSQLAITSSTRFEDIEKQVKETPLYEEVPYNVQKGWFNDFLYEKQKEENTKRAEKQREYKQLYFDLFDTWLSEGKIADDSQYSTVAALLKDCELTKKCQEEGVAIKLSYTFGDYMNRLKDRMQLEERCIKEYMAVHQIMLTSTTTFEEMNEMIKKEEENPSAEITDGEKKEKVKKYGELWFVFVERRPGVAKLVYQRMIRDIKKDEEKRYAKSPEGEKEKNFRHLLKEYLYEKDHLEYSYEDVEAQLGKKKRWASVEDDKKRRQWFKEYMDGLKEKLAKKSHSRRDRRH